MEFGTMKMKFTYELNVTENFVAITTSICDDSSLITFKTSYRLLQILSIL